VRQSPRPTEAEKQKEKAGKEAARKEEMGRGTEGGGGARKEAPRGVRAQGKEREGRQQRGRGYNVAKDNAGPGNRRYGGKGGNRAALHMFLYFPQPAPSPPACPLRLMPIKMKFYVYKTLSSRM